MLVITVALLALTTTSSSAELRPYQKRNSSVICKVFGSYCRQALNVAWCESRWSEWARNGQYRGLFQMGSWERRTFGHGNDPWTQSRAALRYFVISGRDWSPWSCRWAA